jgi:hypothetical protein
MAKFTNTGEGPRGINLKDGTTVWADPGHTVEVDEKDATHVHADFEKGDKAAKDAAKDSEAEA